MNAEQDPFASVRINRIPQSNQEPRSQQEDPFAAARVNKTEEKPIIYETGRHAARIGSRIAETIGGIPGDVSSLISSGVFAGMEKLTGKHVPEEEREQVKSKFPTSAELKKKSIEKTKGFTKAQGPYEEIGDEIATTAASLLGPMKFRRALEIGIGSQIAKEGIKISGLGEGSQEGGKLGTMFLMSMFNPGGAMKYASSQYDKANKLAKGASVDVSKIKSNLSSLRNEMEKGVETSSKNAVLKPIHDLLEKMPQGKKLAVDELTTAKRDINTLMGDPTLLKREKNLLKAVGGEVDKAIGVYEKINPAFKKAYRPANEIYGAVMQGNKAANFINKILGPKSVLGAIAGEAALQHPEAILPTLGAAAAFHVTARAGDFFTRVAKSPELQKFYVKAMAAAVAEDTAALRIYADKMEEILNQKTPQSSKR
jgi:hypothetical protein